MYEGDFFPPVATDLFIIVRFGLGVICCGFIRAKILGNAKTSTICMLIIDSGVFVAAGKARGKITGIRGNCVDLTAD